MAPRKSAKPVTFEAGLERLEAIAQQMERSELPLEELLTLYEEGVKLSEELNAKLDAAQGRMMELRPGRDGELDAVPSDVIHQETMMDALGENGGEA